jgi:NAD(P)-dependent dehydrogenase (short-subunit alcohol dehydrogenase family)
VLADLALRPEAQRLVDEYSTCAVDKPRAVFCRTDVTDWVQLECMFDVAAREFGGVDIVCPGAGIHEPQWGDFWNLPGAKKSRDHVRGNRYAVLDINVVHPIRTAQLAIQMFLDPPEGRKKVSPKNQKRIVIVSSVAAQMPMFLTPMYVASKHAM